MPSRQPTAEEAIAATGLGSEYSLVYTSSQLADVFGKSRKWVVKANREGWFVRPDNGERIEPKREGKFLLWYIEDVQLIAVQWFQKGLIGETELKRITRRLIRDTAIYDRDYLVRHADD